VPVPKTATPAPTQELGANQWLSSLGEPILEELESDAALIWPSSNDTYAAMLNDAHVEGMYRGVMLPVRSYPWYLDPNGAPPTAIERTSTDYRLPIGEAGTVDQRRARRRFIFADHLEDALRAPAYGHGFFEQVFEVLQDGNPTLNGGWVAHLRKLASRPPRTIHEIRPARDGSLAYIKVPPLNPGVNNGSVMSGVDIPISRLVAYVWDREGANWRGRSMLRSCYRPWKLKDRVLRIGAANIAKGGGVPYVEAAPGTTRAQMEELQQLASSFRVGEESGAALPYGAQLKFAMAAGGDGAVAYVQLQNEEMARAWVQMLMVLGQTQTGSRALGETFADRADLVQHAIAGWFADTFNRHVIEDDVEINEGPGTEYAPLLRYKATGSPVDALAGALDNAQAAGALPADSQAAATVKGEQARQRRAPAAVPHKVRATATTAGREPTAAEQTAGVDFVALQTTYAAAVGRLRRKWAAITASQIDELVAQVQRAVSVDDLALLSATTAGADVLGVELGEVLADGAASAIGEAAHQGVTIEPDLTVATAAVEQHAAATAELLARAVAQSAASHAVSVAATQPDTTAVAASVRDHLETLAGTARDYELAGAVTHAQNAGRFAVMDQGPAGRLYASELNDTATCEFCAEVDGTEYTSMADMLRDYGAGHYVGCQGGNRCRGTAVKVYGES
jgi:hypothetical protein